MKWTKLWNLKAEHIGSIVNVWAIVVKMSDVKPKIWVASFICEACNSEIH